MEEEQKARVRYGIYICDPRPWARGHTHWRVPQFFPFVHGLSPDRHGPWVLPLTERKIWGRERISPGVGPCRKVTIGGECHVEMSTGHHSKEYFDKRRYWAYNKGKAIAKASKIKKAHPHLIVRVDAISD